MEGREAGKGQKRQEFPEGPSPVLSEGTVACTRAKERGMGGRPQRQSAGLKEWEQVGRAGGEQWAVGGPMGGVTWSGGQGGRHPTQMPEDQA